MKRVVSILLIAAVLFCGCAKSVPVESVPLNFEDSLQLAEQLYNEGDYEETILTLTDAIEIEPTNPRGYLRMADVYLAQGDKDKALEWLEQGLEKTWDREIAQRIWGMTRSVDGVRDVRLGKTESLIVMNDGTLYYSGYDDINDESTSLIPMQLNWMDDVAVVSGDKWNRFIYTMTSLVITESGELYARGRYPDPNIDGSGSMKYAKNPKWIMSDVSNAVFEYASSPMICTLFTLKTDGTLLSNGGNTYGQLGRGLPVADNMYEIEQFYSAGEVLTNVASVDFNGKMACAVTKDGSLYVWGLIGQEYEANDINTPIYYDTPQRILDGVTNAVFWGSSTDDLLISRDGKSLESIIWDSPYAIDGFTTKEIVRFENEIMDISCGWSHVLVLDIKGELHTFGTSNEQGQLGVDKTLETPGTVDEATGELVSYDVFMPIPGKIIREISAGNNSSAAVDADGKLYTWGYNKYGQLANGRSGNQRSREETQKVMGNIRTVFSNSPYSVSAITAEGELYSWGAINEEIYPKKVFTNVLNACDDLVVTTDGGLYVPNNALSYYTHGWDSTEFEPSEDIPDYTRIMSDIVYVYTAGGNHYVCMNDGTLLAWGANSSVPIGNGKFWDTSSADYQYVEQPEQILERVKQVSNAHYTSPGTLNYTLYLTEKGDLYACYVCPARGIQQLTPIKWLNGIKKVDNQKDYIYVINQRGSLVAMPPHNETDGEEVTLLKGPIVDIAFANDSAGLALGKDGTVYEIIRDITGKDYSKSNYSRIRGSTKSKFYYCTVFENAVDIGTCEQFGDITYYVVDRNGDLYSWGDNTYGQLGIGDTGQFENVFTIEIEDS